MVLKCRKDRVESDREEEEGTICHFLTSSTSKDTDPTVGLHVIHTVAMMVPGRVAGTESFPSPI